MVRSHKPDRLGPPAAPLIRQNLLDEDSVVDSEWKGPDILANWGGRHDQIRSLESMVELSKNDTSWSDPALHDGLAYQYKVTAVIK